MRVPPRRSFALLAATALALAGCASASADPATGTGTGTAAGTGTGSTSSGELPTLRLGYFPNVTHATPVVGVEKGFYTDALDGVATLQTTLFNAGPAAVEALFSGAIDAAYMGPNPTVNGFVQSDGAAVRVISGAASGGAFLVVRDGIDTPADLAGAKLATPQLGNTQDVALRYWLTQQGLTSDLNGGGDVAIQPQANSDTLTAFAAGAIDGAWLPEPYATRLVDAGAHVLVDERDLWPDGMFVTTNLVVHPDYLTAHPDVVKALLEGQVTANEWINANPAEAQQVVGDAIASLSGKALPDGVIAKAWDSITFTDDPVATSLVAGAEHAAQVGVLDGVPDLTGLYDLSLLNEVLTEHGLPTVDQP